MEVGARRGSGGYRDGCADRISRRSGNEGGTRVVDRSDPVAHFLRRLGLKVECPRRRDKTERVRVLLEHNGRARVDVREVEQPEELVLSVGFVKRQMRRAQHKPPLLPRLSDGRGDKSEIEMWDRGARTPGRG